MKNHFTFLILVFLISMLFASDESYSQHRIGISISPIGYYSYIAYPPTSTPNYFDGGFWEIGLCYQNRIKKIFGIETYFDFKGYRYEDHKENDAGFIRFWGLPNFKIGISGVFSLFQKEDGSELSIAAGLEYAHYIADVDEHYPGIGTTCCLKYVKRVSPKFGIGPLFNMHFSYHGGKEYPDEPGSLHYAFTLSEFVGGVQFYFYL